VKVSDFLGIKIDTFLSPKKPKVVHFDSSKENLYSKKSLILYFPVSFDHLKSMF
jgi:hypothetical protein